MSCLMQTAISAHAGLLAMSSPIHEQMCKMHGIRYKPMIDPHSISQEALWSGLRVLQHWLRTEAEEGEVGIMMEADTLWVDPSVNIAEVLPPGEIFGWVKKHPGVLFVRRSRLCQSVVNLAVKQARPVTCFSFGKRRDDSYAIVDALHDRRVSAFQFDHRFNDYDGIDKGHDCGPVIIKGWHAQSMKCKMRGMMSWVPQVSRLITLFERKQKITEVTRSPSLQTYTISA